MYRCLLVIAGVVLATSCQVAVAQSGKVAPQADEPVTKAYRVSDLIVLTPDYSFRGIQLPGLENKAGFGSAVGGMGAMGGVGGGFGAASVAANAHVLSQMGACGPQGMGGFGGGMGGGMMGVMGMGVGGGMGRRAASPTVGSVRFSTDDLIEAITTLVAPESWDEVGGRGSITSLGGMLLVSQTPAVQKEITEFLSTIREQGASPQSITVRAFWVLVSSDQLSQLQSNGAKSMQTVDRKTLEGLGDAMVARGQLTCFDGQTVHVISGRVCSSFTSLIPVVGQVDRTDAVSDLAQGRKPAKIQAGSVASSLATPSTHLPGYVLAQVPTAVQSGAPMSGGGGFLASAGRSSVGYQPVVSSVNFGIALQVIPSVVPDTKLVVLDLQSTVTRKSRDPGTPVNFQQAGLDRLDLVVQQFKTTLRVPMGQPVLVAGSTLEPPIATGSSDGQLYLIVEAVLANEGSAAGKK